MTNTLRKASMKNSYFKINVSRKELLKMNKSMKNKGIFAADFLKKKERNTTII